MALQIDGLSVTDASAYPIKRCPDCGSESNRLKYDGHIASWHCNECGHYFKNAGRRELLTLINYLIYRR